MEAIRILIVEDEPIIAKDLSYMLQDIGYSIVGISYDEKSALGILKEKDVDLVMLDINLDGGQEGIALAEVINSSFKIPFIFLTSYADQGTITRAKSTFPLAYLIKPIDEKDLVSTIEVALHNYNNKITNTDETLPKDNVLFIRERSCYSKINVQDIVYAEAQDNYAFIHTAEKKYLLSSTLKSVELKLSPYGFKRIHRSYLINTDHIVKLEDGYVFMTKDHLPIGKKYKNGFYEKVKFL